MREANACPCVLASRSSFAGNTPGPMHSLEEFEEGVTWNVQKLNAAPFAMLASMHGACAQTSAIYADYKTDDTFWCCCGKAMHRTACQSGLFMIISNARASE